MAKVYFKVLTKATEPEKEVFIRVRFKTSIVINGRRKTIDQGVTTGETVKLKYWNLETQSLRKSDFKGKDALVSRLEKLKGAIIEEALKAEGKFTKGWLNSVVHKSDEDEEINIELLPWLENYIKNLHVAKRTKYKYLATYKSLQDYNSQLRWADLDHRFYINYVSALQKQGWAKNTIFDRIKVIKAIARAGEIAKVHNSTDYKQFRLETEESDSVYLNESEISRILKVNLSRHPWLIETRDLFVLACWLGVRFGDFDKIRSENIKGNLIYFKQAKTRGRVVVPLHPMAKAIIDKYNGELPKAKANQPFNRDLKLVAKAARLRQKEIKGITKGGVYNEQTLEKWQMVSAHTARRSFATNLYLQGVETITIMKMTGHRTQSAFLKYIKVSEEEHARRLEEHYNKIYDNTI